MAFEISPELKSFPLPIDDPFVAELQQLRAERQLHSINEVVQTALAQVTTRVFSEVDLTPGTADWEYLRADKPTFRMLDEAIASKPPRVTILDPYAPEYWTDENIDLQVRAYDLGRAGCAAELCGIDGRGRFAYQAVRYLGALHRQQPNKSDTNKLRPDSNPNL